MKFVHGFAHEPLCASSVKFITLQADGPCAGAGGLGLDAERGRVQFCRRVKLLGEALGLALLLLKGATSLRGWNTVSSDQPGCAL